MVRFVLGAKVCTFGDAYDAAYSISEQLKPVLQRAPAINMLTDSKWLFDTIVKHSTTTEKQLETNLPIIQKAYTRREISDISFLRYSYNPAGALTKMNTNEILERVLDENILDHKIEQ